jgi:phosphoadenosine phosphosulfate reductase
MSTNTSAAQAARALDTLLAGTSDLAGRLAITRDQLRGRIVFTSSFGREDQAILHAVATARLDVSDVTFDTGRLFPETLETIEATAGRYRIPISVISPDASATQALIARDGVLGFRTSIEARKACCDVRKVIPLEGSLKGAAGWIVGLRRDQSTDRSGTPLVAYDDVFGVLKISPLADWTDQRLTDFLDDHDIPTNPLHAKGYPSIGCAPCTRAVAPGGDPRSGRWWWEQYEGKECGLHAGRRGGVAA